MRRSILFKCLTTRAVLIDILSSLDQDSFLMALRRFISRRGKPAYRGIWEREIKSIKAALYATIQMQTITEEVLWTVLIEVEGILNSKPLGYVSSDITDPITPNLLLRGRPDLSLPQVVYPESELLSRCRWRHTQVLGDHFWRKFIRHYLPALQTCTKWQKEMTPTQPGSVVMIWDPQLPSHPQH